MASNSQSWKSVRVNPTTPGTPQQPPSSSAAASIRSPFTPTAALVMNSKGAIPTTPVAAGTNGGTPGITSSSAKKDAALPRILVIHDPKLQPTPVRVSNSIASRDFAQPSHRFDQVANAQTISTLPQLQQQQIPATGGPSIMKSSRVVDSRAQMKPIGLSNNDIRSIGGSSVDSSQSVKSVPQFIGSSFAHLPNSKRVYVPTELPAHPTLPKPYPGLVPGDFYTQDGFLSNRTADGKILGNVTKRFVSEAHVPYYDQNEHIAVASSSEEVPVGPDNPYQPINDTWTKCWDKEAGAVYYYNIVSGEATWIMPDL